MDDIPGLVHQHQHQHQQSLNDDDNNNNNGIFNSTKGIVLDNYDQQYMDELDAELNNKNEDYYEYDDGQNVNDNADVLDLTLGKSELKAQMAVWEKEMKNDENKQRVSENLLWRRNQPRRRAIRAYEDIPKQQKPQQELATTESSQQQQQEGNAKTSAAIKASIASFATHAKAMTVVAELRRDRRISVHVKSLFAFLSIVPAVWANEVLLANGKGNVTTSLLKTVIMLASVVLTVRVVGERAKELKRRIISRELLSFGRESTGFFLASCVEVFVCLFHVPPIIDYSFHVNWFNLELVYNLDCIASTIITMRFYLFLDSIREEMTYKQPEIARAAAKAQIDMQGMYFFIKRMLDTRRAISLGSATVSVILWVSYTIRTLECPLTGDDGCQLRDMSLSIWMIIVSFCTVGYGDYVPKTHFGRVFTSVAIIAGILISSMATTVVATYLELSQKEKRLVRLHQTVELENKVLNQAAACVQAAYKRMRARKISAAMKGRSVERERIRIHHEARADYLFQQFRKRRIERFRHLNTKTPLESCLDVLNDQMSATIPAVRERLSKAENNVKLLFGVVNNITAEDQEQTRMLQDILCAVAVVAKNRPSVDEYALEREALLNRIEKQQKEKDEHMYNSNFKRGRFYDAKKSRY